MADNQLRAGARVTIIGLRARGELNGVEAELLGLRMGINGASPEKLQDRRRKEIRRNLVEEMMDDEPVARGAVWWSGVV